MHAVTWAWPPGAAPNRVLHPTPAPGQDPPQPQPQHPSPIPLPLIGTSAQVEGIPQCCHFSRAPQRIQVSPSLSTDSSEPFVKRPVEQPIKSHWEGQPHVQIPLSRPGPSLRESGVGGGNGHPSITCSHLGTPVGNWEDQRCEIGGRSRSSTGIPRRLCSGLGTVLCKREATREHMSASTEEE